MGWRNREEWEEEEEEDEEEEEEEDEEEEEEMRGEGERRGREVNKGVCHFRMAYELCSSGGLQRTGCSQWAALTP